METQPLGTCEVPRAPCLTPKLLLHRAQVSYLPEHLNPKSCPTPQKEQLPNFFQIHFKINPRIA